MSSDPNSNGYTHKREHSPEKNINNNEQSPSKIPKVDSVSTEGLEEYEWKYKYIQPRRMSIYAPHYKYGPNRRTSDDEEDDETTDEPEIEPEGEVKLCEEHKKNQEEDEQTSEAVDEIEENDDEDDSITNPDN